MTIFRMAVVFVGLMLLAAGASAQTKISGTFVCAKPDPTNMLPIGDRPGHAFLIMKNKCSWTKPMELAGVQSKSAEDTTSVEANGAKSRDSGYHTTTMANGDKFVVRFGGVSTLDKNGAVQTQSGTWSFVRGTGKMKGITGKGTYTGKGAADGSVTTEVKGEYQIAGK